MVDPDPDDIAEWLRDPLPLAQAPPELVKDVLRAVSIAGAGVGAASAAPTPAPPDASEGTG